MNDAPALAAADISFAVGLVRARKAARVTLRGIKQNLFFAFAYTALGVPIAAGAAFAP